jgi:alpha-beta hydrolase superfamily lysophospholipase
MACRAAGHTRLATVTAALAVLTLPFVPPGASGASGAIVDRSVAFSVINANRTDVVCPADGRSYVVRGHLTGPQRALRGPASRAATVYVHGFSAAEWSWRVDVPGHHFAREMAKRGHVSLTIDRLGYARSDHPPGTLVCLGSAADALHQIVASLRSGGYQITGKAQPVRFDRIVVAGHDTGGIVAPIAAYVWKDVDAVIQMMAANPLAISPTPPDWIPQWVAEASIRCLTGGQPSRKGAASYTDFGPADEDIEGTIFYDVDPRVARIAFALRDLNPCGDVFSAGPADAQHVLRLGEIAVPVLLVYSDHDAAFSPTAADTQPLFYTGTDDVSVSLLQDTGHFPMFERAAPAFYRVLSQWLRTRGLASAGADRRRGRG